MKKKLKIDFLKNGSDSDKLTKLVANHNGGLNPVSLDDIASYMWCLRSIWGVNKDNNVHAIKQEDEPNKLFINEDGATYCIIEEIELHELNGDDLNGLFTSTKEENSASKDFFKNGDVSLMANSD